MTRRPCTCSDWVEGWEFSIEVDKSDEKTCTCSDWVEGWEFSIEVDKSDEKTMHMF